MAPKLRELMQDEEQRQIEENIGELEKVMLLFSIIIGQKIIPLIKENYLKDSKGEIGFSYIQDKKSLKIHFGIEGCFCLIDKVGEILRFQFLVCIPFLIEPISIHECGFILGKEMSIPGEDGEEVRTDGDENDKPPPPPPGTISEGDGGNETPSIPPPGTKFH